MVKDKYDFQDDCVEYLVDKTMAEDSKQVITVKAPTGAGKTIILIKYVDEYLNVTDGQTAFIWLCPGKGNLEQQSKRSMEEFAPHLDTRDLQESLAMGFDGGSITFINWELVTKKGNRAITEGERANIFETIAKAHKAGIQFIVIVDEEHSNNTKKADDIICAFAPKNRIRVSATAKEVKHHEFYEIPEEDVINAGLITRAIYVNEGVDDNRQVTNDYDYLLELADEKRKEIQSAYESLGIKIRPLVIIQFPSGQQETIDGVEAKLEELGYTYENGLVSIWMSKKKQNIEDITNNGGQQAFLLMKQAISTGWDCPRAKILVKLREGGSEQFQIQTIGRIRRMPERKHYGLDILDFCYIYTLDTSYKEGLLSEMDKAYQVRRLFVRDDVRDFKMTKELRDLDFEGLGERDILLKVYNYFKDTYGLGNNKSVNKENLEAGGYSFSREIDSKIVQGVFRTTSDIEKRKSTQTVTIKTVVNTHSHGIYLLHAVDEIKRATGMQSQAVKNILERMFRKGKERNYKFIALETNDFYAFVINNSKKLKIDFKSVTIQLDSQMSFAVSPKTTTFHVPEMEIYKYSDVKARMLMRLNAYKEYTNEFITDKTRSLPERLFERYCETRGDKIDWVYKNGDAGQQYLSIVYLDALLKQWLFYPDYIVHTTDGQDWLIETKGGEASGHTKNIDKNVELKFRAFKSYAEKYNVNFGFVRDLNEELYVNNTEYHEEMSDASWRPLSDVL